MLWRCGYLGEYCARFPDFIGVGVKTHFRELAPQESVAVLLIFLVPAGQRHSRLIYDLYEKTIESVQKMEMDALFAHPEAAYLPTRIEIPVPQS